MARLIDGDKTKRAYTAELFDTADDCERVNDILDYAETVSAVPVSELLSLRDNLYEDNLITMRGLRDLNMLIAKYEGGTEK